MSSGISSVWHKMPQSAAVIARLHEAELARSRVVGIWHDSETYNPLTERAGRHLERLDALRSEAVSKEIGYTFADTQAPYDDARCRAWVALYASAPTVFEVLRDAFAAREARAARKAVA